MRRTTQRRAKRLEGARRRRGLRDGDCLDARIAYTASCCRSSDATGCRRMPQLGRLHSAATAAVQLRGKVTGALRVVQVRPVLEVDWIAVPVKDVERVDLASVAGQR